MKFAIATLLLISFVCVYSSNRRQEENPIHSKSKYRGQSRDLQYDQTRKEDRYRETQGTRGRGTTTAAGRGAPLTRGSGITPTRGRGTPPTIGRGTQGTFGRGKSLTRGRGAPGTFGRGTPVMGAQGTLGRGAPVTRGRGAAVRGRGRGRGQTADGHRRNYNAGNPKYRCSPVSPRDPNGPIPNWLHTELSDLETVTSDPPPPQNIILYEAARYPRLQTIMGHLPPPDIPNSVFYIYRVPMITGLNFESFDMVRLPYEYASLNREECEVFTKPEFNPEPFFVLENVGNNLDTYLVRIRKDGTGNEYVDLPYYSAQRQMFLRRTWIVRTYQEQEENEPHPEYGYYSISEAQYNENRVPLNAFQLMLHSRIDRHPPTALPAEIPKERRNDLMLAVSWLPSICIKLINTGIWRLREMCNYDDWSIHGLWMNGYREVQTKSDLHFRVLREGTDYELEENMREKWGALQPRPVSHTMSMMWNKHGRHLYKSPLVYFNETRKLFAKVLAKLRKTEILKLTDDVDTTQFSIIRQKVESEFGVKPHYACVNVGRGTQFSLLFDLRFCYKRNGAQFMLKNCQVNEQMLCQEMVYFPKHSQLYPYVYQSVYWFPSMAARLSTYIQFNENGTQRAGDAKMNFDHKKFENWFPQWKFRGLCRMTYTPYQVRRYVDHFNFYDKSFPSAALMTRFKHKSPDIVSVGRYGFYRYKYCGVPLRLVKVMKLKGPWGYFRTSQELFDELRTFRLPPVGQSRYKGDTTKQVDKEANGFAMDQRLKVASVRDRINKLIGNDVFLECFTNQKGAKILLKFVVCYNSENNNLVRGDCPDVKLMYRQKETPLFPPEMKKRDEWSASIVDCGNGDLYIPSGKQNVLAMGKP